MRESNPKFIAGPKGVADIEAENKKDIQETIVRIQNALGKLYSTQDKSYWQSLANNFLQYWTIKDLKILSRETDKRVFLNQIKMEYLLNLILSGEIATVKGNAYFSPEDIKFFTES